MRVPPLPYHHVEANDQNDSWRFHENDEYGQDIEEEEGEEEYYAEYDEEGDEYGVYSGDCRWSEQCDEGNAENDDDDDAHMINPSKNHSYVVYSSTESENETDTDSSISACKKATTVKILSQKIRKKNPALSKFRQNRHSFFSQHSVYITSRTEKDDSYSQTRGKPRVPHDDLNLCIFTALAKFKFPKSDRMVKLSKFLFVAWKNKTSKLNSTFDWGEITNGNGGLDFGKLKNQVSEVSI